MRLWWMRSSPWRRASGLRRSPKAWRPKAQWQYLKDCDANQVQGFLFCRPLAIADLERWHADWLLSRRRRDAGAA